MMTCAVSLRRRSRPPGLYVTPVVARLAVVCCQGLGRSDVSDKKYGTKQDSDYHDDRTTIVLTLANIFYRCFPSAYNII